MKDYIYYLRNFKINPIIIRKADDIISLCENLFKFQIEDIFLSESIDTENKIIPEEIFLFSGINIFKISELLPSDIIKLTAYTNKIQSWTIYCNNYDFNNKGHYNSRLCIILSLQNNINIELKAARENCDRLKSIFINCIIPNYKVTKGSSLDS
jgi:hypothetical protein